ncbi:hypothetical protein HanRHA438_Chr11g0504681 [Helianthus annuus]|nr:hypothetical protein HanIR_Chr11g0529711 [Helianthus annuus]KAJ0870813.1 hypothetical protein HanRHA438_Chr11g0504681 [Helianthus annuus]
MFKLGFLHTVSIPQDLRLSLLLLLSILNFNILDPLLLRGVWEKKGVDVDLKVKV